MNKLISNILFLRKADLYMLMHKEKEYQDHMIDLALKLNERINYLENKLENSIDNRNH